MRYNLKKPCKDCPFTRDCLTGWLGAARMREIVASLKNDFNVFPCHETTQDGFDDDGVYRATGKESACVGALLFQEEHNLRAVLTRLNMAMKKFDPRALQGRSRIFRTEEEAIRHHTH